VVFNVILKNTERSMKCCNKGFNPEYSKQSPSIEEITRLNGYVILEFGTSWCGHCQAAEPAIKEVLSVLELPHIKVEDGKGKPLGRLFKVKLWPTIILLNSGQEVARVVRPLQTDEIKDLIAIIDE
jgi:thioredoxin 1